MIFDMGPRYHVGTFGIYGTVLNNTSFVCVDVKKENHSPHNCRICENPSQEYNAFIMKGWFGSGPVQQDMFDGIDPFIVHVCNNCLSQQDRTRTFECMMCGGEQYDTFLLKCDDGTAEICSRCLGMMEFDTEWPPYTCKKCKTSMFHMFNYGPSTCGRCGKQYKETQQYSTSTCVDCTLESKQCPFCGG